MFIKYKKKLLDITESYTGAEIEKAIKEGIALSFYANEKDLTIDYLVQGINDTRPISKTMPGKINSLRDLAKEFYRNASLEEEIENNLSLVKKDWIND